MNIYIWATVSIFNLGLTHPLSVFQHTSHLTQFSSISQMLSRFLNKFHFTLGLGFILNFIVSGGKTQIQGYAQLSSTKLSDISRNNPNDPVVGLGAIQSLAPQAHQSSLTPTMFHYQMYPQVHSPSAFKAGKRKRCIMTENGMKCKHRRDGTPTNYS